MTATRVGCWRTTDRRPQLLAGRHRGEVRAALTELRRLPLTKDAVDTRVAEREAKAITAIEAVQAAVLSVVLTSFWLVVSPLVQQPVCCDAGEYLRLARDPTSPMLAPTACECWCRGWSTRWVATS